MSELTSENRLWVAGARVFLIPGETQHYSISENQLFVSVRTLQHGVMLWAEMPGGSRDGSGLWHIPSIGTEVCVSFSMGEFEGDAYVVGVVGYPPPDLTPGKTIVQDDQVIVRSAGGTATSFVALQDEVHALWEFVRAQFSTVGGHTHAVVGGATTTTTSVAPPGGTPPAVSPAEPLGSQILSVE